MIWSQQSTSARDALLCNQEVMRSLTDLLGSALTLHNIDAAGDACCAAASGVWSADWTNDCSSISWAGCAMPLICWLSSCLAKIVAARAARSA